MKWKSNFEKGKEIILSTCSLNNLPNSNIIISMGIIDDKLLVADCQMDTTIKNLKEYKINSAILISINEVFDLDNVAVIN